MTKVKPSIRKLTQARLRAARRFQQPTHAHPTATDATADKTPENGFTAAAGPTERALDNPIIQALLTDLMDGAEIEVQR